MNNNGIPRYAIVLTGGGARGAYQVGVLKALSQLSSKKEVRFPVITGVSVGAINAAALASHFDDFKQAAEQIENFWRRLHTNDVIDARVTTIMFNGLRMFLSEFIPYLQKNTPKSLLENAPLWHSVERGIDFGKVSRAIAAEKLYSIGVTCSGYSTGNAKTFFETASHKREWHRERRDGIYSRLTLDHVMASTALPVLFPSVKIGDEYFGDGSLRLTSPLAPAIHLGGTKLLIVGTRDRIQAAEVAARGEHHYPSMGDLAGYALDTIFHDNLDADIERLQRINQTLELIPAEKRQGTPLQHIETLVINPSRNLKEMALAFRHEMPRALKWILASQGTSEKVGLLESYLLFEPGFIGSLIDLGYQDTLAMRQEILAFFCD
ncbi:MAG: patatin-like phospholipase family protein [Sneathiella sp.]|nr:patatin-like phospholipase family protein [Sneathiella sp.]